MSCSEGQPPIIQTTMVSEDVYKIYFKNSNDGLLQVEKELQKKHGKDITTKNSIFVVDIAHGVALAYLLPEFEKNRDNIIKYGTCNPDLWDIEEITLSLQNHIQTLANVQKRWELLRIEKSLDGPQAETDGKEQKNKL